MPEIRQNIITRNWVIIATERAKRPEDFANSLCHGLADPDYNYVIRSFLKSGHSLEYYYWYISIIPRLSEMAGFELGSGMFINASLPEESTKFLRNTKCQV